ncbi:hypothetical protein [Spirosoma endbachense]|uniref:Uncharacterized protein n=1 Tax=Spirosoma endbachense TaxID=2666025 RepID=A0A6P1W5N8_9BACT|nr:hypothetical protein [Spirosoma endbachense]QHW00215.1 hypothetical protein GJR95_36640 [Spirosoma endbachense]
MKTNKQQQQEPSPTIDDITKEAKRLYAMGFSLKNAVWLAITTLRGKTKNQ